MALDFHMTVGTFPSGKLELTEELRLLRPALLYADRVTLYSFMAATWLRVMDTADFSLATRLALLERSLPRVLPPPQAVVTMAFWKKLKQKIRNTSSRKRRRVLRQQLHELVSHQWEEVREQTLELGERVGLPELRPAMEAGILDIHEFSHVDSDESFLDFLAEAAGVQAGNPTAMRRQGEELVREYVSGVSSAVSDGTTYPLLDAGAGVLVRLGLATGQIAAGGSAVSRARHSGLAGQLLGRLTTADVPISVILDVRRELDDYLARFRGAVVRFADGIREAPWEQGFEQEAERIYRREVAPAVEELREALRAHRLLPKLAERVSTSGIAIGMSQLPELPELLALSFGVAGTTSAATIYSEFSKWWKGRQEIRNNGLYFYYAAGEKLDAADGS